MATSYPAGLDNFTNPTGSDNLDSSVVPHATQHANANDAIEAIEAELGTNPKGASATVKARLDTLAPLASPTFTGTVTMTSPVIDNIKIGYTTTVTSASAVTLTATSNFKQYFTGSTAQTVILPVTSTLALGMSYEINNNSSATITVQSSGLNTIATIPAAAAATFTVILTSGTGSASWDYEFTGFNTVTGTGSNVLSGSPSISGTLSASVISTSSYQRFPVAAVTTPIAAATHTVSTSADIYVIYDFAGTVTVTLPTASSYPGRFLTLKTNQAQAVVSASANVIPLVGGAAGTAILAATAGKWAHLVSNGTNWVIMMAN